MKGAERDVLISIRGIQQDDEGQDQIIELTTAGTLWRDGDTVCISYVETEMTGLEGVKPPSASRRIRLSWSGRANCRAP